MKHLTVEAEILGEKYRLSGRPGVTNRALEIFRETLEETRRETRGREVSTHRLGVLAGLLLAEKLALLEGREGKRAVLLGDVRREVAGLVEVLRAEGAVAGRHRVLTKRGK